MPRGRPRFDDLARQESKRTQVRNITQWKREHVDRLAFETRKEIRLNERIMAAVADGKAKSRQEYMLMAIETQLAKDGYPAPTIPEDE